MTKPLSVGDIKNLLDKFAPPTLAEEWDNVGLQIGSLQAPVSSILVSLDVTEAVLWEAVEHDANLLVTHHPLLLRPLNCLDDSKAVSRLARLAVQMDLNILSFHTNLDSTREGLNDQLAKAMSLRQIKPLLPSRDPRHPTAGLGRIGKIKKTRLQDFLKTVSRNLKIREFRYVGDLKHPIETVAVLTGSGGGFSQEAKKRNADVLITGDVKYHHALDSLAEGIALVDIGHYRGEIGMVELIAKKLKKWVKEPKIKIFQTRAQSDPLQFWRR